MTLWGSSLALGRASVLAFLASPATRHGAAPAIRTAQRQPVRRPYSATATLAVTNYLLRYDYIPDVLEKRAPHREGHLELAKRLIEEGKCLSGGPTGEPAMKVPSGALFVFTDEESAKLFVKEDPYVEHGIVTGHSIEEWNVVVQKE